MNWKQEQEALENAFVRQLLIKYNIKETTTQRQAKNGTREFEFPVPARKYHAMNKLVISKERLRLACFTTGCLLYTSPSPRDKRQSRMPSSA